MLQSPEDPAVPLVDDCARCVGLCCVALAFSRSTDFALDKPAGTPCPNLEDTFGCGIHQDLTRRGFRGCVTYTCFGAGPRVTRSLHGGDWRADPELAREAFAVFPLLRQVHELLWHLRAALGERVHGELRGELHAMVVATETLAQAANADLLASEVSVHRDRANAVLLAVSEHLRGPRPGPDLRGADLIGAHLAGRSLRRASLRGAQMMGADLRDTDLRRADLTGADLRDADLSGADLRGALFLTPSQLVPTRGSAGTRLPRDLARPGSW